MLSDRPFGGRRPAAALTVEVRPVLVVLLVATVAAVTVWRLPEAFRGADNAIAAGSQRSQLERRLVPATAFGVDPRLLVRARELIPPASTYMLITGKRLPAPGLLTLLAAPRVAVYWLLPRRAVEADPDWVVSYGGDLRSLALRYARIVRVAPGLEIAQVSR